MNKLSEKYYYIRDRQNRPMITVCCLCNEQGVVARGVAICSKRDNPCKEVGRGYALSRAKLAVTNSASGLEIRREEALRPVHSFFFKSTYMPVTLPLREVGLNG